MRRRRRSREEWTALVAEFEQGQMTQAEFAKRRRVGLGSLRSWIYKLRGEDAEERSDDIRFVEVVGVEGGYQAEAVAVALEWPGGMRLSFKELPPPSYLAAVLQGLPDPSAC